MWVNYKIESPEDQQKAILPLNRDTEKLFYNQRMIIDAKVLTEPITWKITKVHRLAPNGLVRLTYAQDRFDQHKDYIEIDHNGDVIGMWADYFQSEIPKEEHPFIIEDDINMVNNSLNYISYNGIKPQIKINGSYKTLTAHFYNSLGMEIEDYDNIKWKYMVDGIDVSGYLEIVTPSNDNELNLNQVKIRFVGSEDYIKEVLTISCSNSFTSFELQLEIVGM